MTYGLLIGIDARTDMAGIVDYYNGQQQGLGSEFVTELHQTLQLITNQPKAFAIIHKRLGFRKKKTNRFPFDVFYKLKARQKTVVIVAVIHESRNPQIWKKRE